MKVRIKIINKKKQKNLSKLSIKILSNCVSKDCLFIDIKYLNFEIGYYGYNRLGAKIFTKTALLLIINE